MKKLNFQFQLWIVLHQKMETCLCQSSCMSSRQLLLKVLADMSGKITIAFHNNESSLNLKNHMAGLHFTACARITSAFASKLVVQRGKQSQFYELM